MRLSDYPDLTIPHTFTSINTENTAYCTTRGCGANSGQCHLLAGNSSSLKAATDPVDDDNTPDTDTDALVYQY